MVVFEMYCAESSNKTVGDYCMNSDECDSGLICKDVMSEDGMPELRCAFEDYEDPEEMYAGEDEHCGYTMTADY
jgi:hypothetical protein